ncbi:MAG: GDP-mannose 4,6-dehydratase [Jatrophihabitantaceae bacterium]
MSPDSGPTAFVTGITGQDGGYLTERLLAEGVSVHGLVHGHDDQASALTDRSPAAVLHEGDLTDADRIRGLIAELEPDEVYNLGGISSVAFSWQQPLLTGQVSGLGAVAVLQACWQLQEQTGRPVRVLQASSAEIFGNPEQAPQNELNPLRPGTPYGAAKAYAHQMVSIFRSRELAASAVILYNHESPRRPETFVTRKITAAAARIAAGRQDSLSLGSLDVRRDWGWAPDYVEAMVRAVRHLHADDYVIATGESHTVADFVAAAFEAAGIGDWQSRVQVDPSFVRPVDATEQRGDASKARTVLGWAPTLDFAAVVAAMVEADLALL